MDGKICVFTSAHRVYDIRIFKKEIRSLLKNGLNVVYYANKENLDTRKEYIKNEESISENNLTLKINDNYYQNKRLKRFIKSLLFFLYLPKDCDIYHFHDPDLLFAGLALKILGKKVIYDVHENYRDSIKDKDYLPGIFKILISWIVSEFETFCCRFFDAIICATPYIEKRFMESKVLRTIVINNYPFISEFTLNKKLQVNKDNRIIYAGCITSNRGITQLVDSLVLINKSLLFKLILAGEIIPGEYEDKIKSLDGWKDTEYMGILSRDILAAEFKKASAGIVLFLPEKNHINAQPNKIFEYMSASIPVICSNFPLWREIVESNNCGICVDPFNKKEIASAIEYILTNDAEARIMGENGRKMVEEKCNWEKEEPKLISVYKQILQSKFTRESLS